jgi:peptidoglycan/LPS O-acetylase OafA/YrhL
MASARGLYTIGKARNAAAKEALVGIFNSIQNCRGVAALLVVFHHLGGNIAASNYFDQPDFALPFRAGGIAGVGFFFVLSGFIISTTHWDDIDRPDRLLAYGFKRALRIYPSYWVIFLAVWRLMLRVTGSSASVPTTVGSLPGALALVPQDPTVSAAPAQSRSGGRFVRFFRRADHMDDRVLHVYCRSMFVSPAG